MIAPIIFLHYHLRSGGVTKVIETQVTALEESGIPYHILTGESYTGDRGMRQTVIPELDYADSTPYSLKKAEALYENCLEAVRQRFGAQEVIWFIHNPALGKNVFFPSLVERLAKEKKKLVLQCHDFSEDGRPENYVKVAQVETLYPISPNIHYVCINNRDLTNLAQAGLPESQLHLLPNTICLPKITCSPHFNSQKIVLYPVRGIRRKNLGEFLLWSVLAPPRTQFVLTLAPENEQWLPYYKVWESLAEELQLPVLLGSVGRVTPPGQYGNTYEDWLLAATHCMTTSVAEGFGLTFLEPLSYGLPLIGRDLPEITTDFKNDGLSLGTLYEKLLVPLSALPADLLKEELKQNLEIRYYLYGRELQPEHVETAWQKLTTDGYLDFGNLPEHYQVELIVQAHSEGFKDFFILGNGEERELIPADIWITQALSGHLFNARSPEELINYSPAAYKDKLESLLTTVTAAPADNPKTLDKAQILDVYLTPQNFHFLRV